MLEKNFMAALAGIESVRPELGGRPIIWIATLMGIEPHVYKLYKKRD